MSYFYFILGSVLASWIYVCAVRYEKKSDMYGRWSICPHCHHRIPFHQMIPIISWVQLKGHCAWCHHEIPVSSFFCELFGALGFLIISLSFDGIHKIGMMIVFCALLYASFCDLLYGLIPDRTHLVIAASAILMISPAQRIHQILYSLALLIVLFFICIWTQSIGMGDGKLISSLALILHPLSILYMISIASTTALIITILKKEGKKGQIIRFGPYLSFGAFVCLCFLERVP